MLLGRAVFGLGGESISVAQSSVTAEWFRGKELALASGITLSVSRLGSGDQNSRQWRRNAKDAPAQQTRAPPSPSPWAPPSVINNSLSPAIARSVSLASAVWFGAVLCLGSFGASLILGAVDRRATRQLRTEERRRQASGMAHPTLPLAPPTGRPPPPWPPRTRPTGPPLSRPHTAHPPLPFAGGRLTQGGGDPEIRAAYAARGHAGFRQRASGEGSPGATATGRRSDGSCLCWHRVGAVHSLVRDVCDGLLGGAAVQQHRVCPAARSGLFPSRHAVAGRVQPHLRL
eukprot:scaffold826_cov65-Isochrysis_galbana.AAC.1